MDEMIEKLKKNKKAFGLLEPEEQECFKNVRKINCLWYHGSGVNDWGSDSGAFSKFDNQTTYAIKPDYKPEPEYVDLEIVENGNWLGIVLTDTNKVPLTIVPYVFTKLYELPSLPNFEQFYQSFGGKPCYVSTNYVAKFISEGKKVFARFRSRN